MPRFQTLLVAFFLWILGGCHALEQQPVPTLFHSAPAPGLASTPAVSQLILLWSYADSHRLGLEIRLRNYPLPPGFETLCPFTAVDWIQGKQVHPLYRNPEQISLDEFYELTRYLRWYCFQERRQNDHADYRLSLTFFDEIVPLPSERSGTLRFVLGEVTATNQVSTLTLPAQGEFSLPFSWPASTSRLTWGSQPAIQSQGFTVTLQRLFVNPSVSWMDACLTYADHHHWQPMARLEVNGRSARSLIWWLLTPFNPQEAETILQSTHRCFAFTIPFTMPLETWERLQIGLEEVQIERDSYTLTELECRNAADAVMRQVENTQIRCIEFERDGKRHHWFEIVHHPNDRSHEEIYQLMLSMLNETIAGGWYWQLERRFQHIP